MNTQPIGIDEMTEIEKLDALYKQAGNFFGKHDPLRLQLAELLAPGATDDEAILSRVRYLLTCEKIVACWREKGIPF